MRQIRGIRYQNHMKNQSGNEYSVDNLHKIQICGVNYNNNRDKKPM